MHRWDSYTFNAEEFLAYDIGEDIMGYFVEYFNQIETVNPELYRRWQFEMCIRDRFWRGWLPEG